MGRAAGADDIWHFDLYRIDSPEDCRELGFDDALDHGIVLVEWPDRLGTLLPDARLDIDLALAGGDARTATLTGHGDWAGRIPALPV